MEWNKVPARLLGSLAPWGSDSQRVSLLRAPAPLRPDPRVSLSLTHTGKGHDACIPQPEDNPK